MPLCKVLHNGILQTRLQVELLPWCTPSSLNKRKSGVKSLAFRQTNLNWETGDYREFDTCDVRSLLDLPRSAMRR